MPLFAETKEKIFGDILRDVVANTNVSRSSPGSKMRALVEAVSKKMGRMWGQFDLNMTQAFLDGAEGRFLSYIGDMMGVSRLGEQPARITSLDRLVKFYVDVGTFGDINGGDPILLTAGTLIGTASAGTGTVYKMIVDTLLSASDFEAYVAVQSVQAGSGINVGRNRLVYHNFIDYDDNINDTLKVMNEADILLGQDGENDTNYRYRISNQVVGIESANSTSILLAALSVPGVADLTTIPYHRGIGTYDLLIKSTVPTTPDTLLIAVQETVEKVSSAGIVVTARAPVEMGLSMVGTLTLKRKVTADEEQSLIESVTGNITDYTNNLDIGEDWVINEAVERVMSTSALIKTVGVPATPFDNLYIYKPSKLEDNKIRSTLLVDYDPADDERVIVETRYAGATPILFRIAV